MKKLTISDKTIWEIKDLAQQAFKDERNLSRFDSRELQIYLILHGLERIMNREGVQVTFELPAPKVEDSMPIDESGLGEF